MLWRIQGQGQPKLSHAHFAAFGVSHVCTVSLVVYVCCHRTLQMGALALILWMFAWKLRLVALHRNTKNCFTRLCFVQMQSQTVSNFVFFFVCLFVFFFKCCKTHASYILDTIKYSYATLVVTEPPIHPLSHPHCEYMYSTCTEMDYYKVPRGLLMSKTISVSKHEKSCAILNKICCSSPN